MEIVDIKELSKAVVKKKELKPNVNGVEYNSTCFLM